MNCKRLADLCPRFHRSPTKFCPDLVSFTCWTLIELWSFVHLIQSLCPNFSRSRARSVFQLGIFLRALRPTHTVSRPARLYSALTDFFFFQNVIAVFVFSDRGVKMLVKCLQICARVFIDRPQNCAQTSFRSCPGLRPNFGHSRSKLCPIMCRSRTKLCPNFGRSRARLCPISFATCHIPNPAGMKSTDITR